MELQKKKKASKKTAVARLLALIKFNKVNEYKYLYKISILFL